MRVDLWIIDLSAAAAGPAPGAWLPATDRERAVRFVRARDAQRFLVRTAAVRAILADYAGVAASALRIERRCGRCGHPQHGKPHVVGASRPLSFSMSSSEDVCLLVVSREARIGVDVERKKHLEPGVLAAAGLRVPHGGDAPRDGFAALRTWVRHEALLKGFGLGLAADMTVEERAEAEHWHLVVVEPVPGYVACVASPSAPKIEVRVRAR